MKRIVACGRTDRHAEQIIAFCNFAKALNEIKEREQNTDLKIGCVAKQSMKTRRVSAAQDRGSYIPGPAEIVKHFRTLVTRFSARV